MGKSRLIYSPTRLRMENQHTVSPYGRLEHVPVDIDRVRTFVDFEVIEIVDEICPYPALLGIDLAFDNLIVINLKKRRMSFEGDVMRVIAPLVPDEGRRYIEPIKEEEYACDPKNIYHVSTSQDDYINSTANGTLSWRSESDFSSDSEEAL